MDYDSTIKKLIQILKFKSSDNLKQLEELWDAVSLMSGVGGSTTSPNNNLIHNSCSSSSKLDELELEFVNQDSSHTTSSSTSSITLESSSSNGANSLKRTQSISTTQKSKKLKISSPTQHQDFSASNNDSMDCQASSQTNNIDEFVIEMGLTCDTCKLLTQDQNNKLVECQECKRMYHQKCHKPQITNDEIQDPRMLWYCVKCAKNVKKLVNKTKNSNEKIQLKRQVSTSSNESSSNQQQIEISENTTNQQNNLSFVFKRDIKNSNSTNELLSSTKSTAGIKGLASLANKLNTQNTVSENMNHKLVNTSHQQLNKNTSPLSNNQISNKQNGNSSTLSVKQRIIASQPNTTILSANQTSINEKNKQALNLLKTTTTTSGMNKSKIS